MLTIKRIIAVFSILFFTVLVANGQSTAGWYTEGKDYAPTRRIMITVTNPLNVPVKGSSVVVSRKSLPFQNIPERWIGIVDPALPSDPEPSLEQLKTNSGYVRRKETNGHYGSRQCISGKACTRRS